MIISRTPFRISFTGGGSDLQSFYRRYHGAVVSTTIDKYMYIMIHPYFHNKIRIKYSRLEDVDTINEIKHPLVRECLRMVGIAKGLEIASIADVPAGTGIGSSSAFAVGLLNALRSYKNKPVNKERLARDACRIEIDMLKEPIGKQDQYAASYGGFNYIRFNPNGKVIVEPIRLNVGLKRKLENNLLLFYVGNERRAAKILKRQQDNMAKKDRFDIVKQLVGLADCLKDSLKKGKIDDFGEVLNQGWQLKKKIVDIISNPRLDEYYKKALTAGAIGGKLLGAGGGGFFLFYCRPKSQSSLRKALNLRELKFNFEEEGSKIIHLGRI
jgi:D-glycero-alpha-D-manno-heptose-7-phosphate kinase